VEFVPHHQQARVGGDDRVCARGAVVHRPWRIDTLACDVGAVVLVAAVEVADLVRTDIQVHGSGTRACAVMSSVHRRATEPFEPQ